MSKNETNVGIWKEILLPYKTEVDNLSTHKSIFAFSPLPVGFGVTLGNALRRVLLSSIKGSAISSIKIDGILHNFTAIPGIKEDTIELIANLKKIVTRTHTDHEYRLFIKKTGPYTIRASDLADQGVEILNPEQVICHVDASGSINMECVVTTGIGYVAEEDVNKNDSPIGTMYLDTLYNPIKQVAFEVKELHAGSKTYEKLIITIETNGAVEPKTVLSMAASILTTHLKNLITIDTHVVKEEVQQSAALTFNPKLLKHVKELKLSGRAKNCIEQKGINYLGDLVIKTEAELLQVPNVGKTSVEEIKMALEKYNLTLGMIVAGWPPKNLAVLATTYNNENKN